MEDDLYYSEVEHAIVPHKMGQPNRTDVWHVKWDCRDGMEVLIVGNKFD